MTLGLPTTGPDSTIRIKKLWLVRDGEAELMLPLDDEVQLQGN
jgi:hypothetical protein